MSKSLQPPFAKASVFLAKSNVAIGFGCIFVLGASIELVLDFQSHVTFMTFERFATGFVWLFLGWKAKRTAANRSGATSLKLFVNYRGQSARELGANGFGRFAVLPQWQENVRVR